MAAATLNVECNVPSHNVPHRVTRHASTLNAPYATTSDDVAESAFAAVERATAMKKLKEQRLRSFQDSLRRRVNETEAARTSTAEQLAREFADIDLVLGDPTVANATRAPRTEPPSALEVLMVSKASGVRSSHQALLNQTRSLASGGGRGGGAVGSAAVSSASGPDRVRAAKEAYASRERAAAAAAREKMKHAERAREERRLQEVAAASDFTAENNAFTAAEDRHREEATRGSLDAEANRRRAREYAKAEAERMKRERKRESAKAKKAARYTTALQDSVRAQLTRKRVTLPPLCACPHAAKSQIFDPGHVYKCAHNCPLHDDEAAYHAALSQLLSAHDVIITAPR
jgi:hypothetical protein